MKIKLRMSASPDLYTETDAAVFGDWAVHPINFDFDIFYRVTHVPTGYAMPERLIGYLDTLDAEDGAQWAWIFEAVAAEAVAS